MRHGMRHHWIGYGIKFVIFAALAAVVCGFVAMYLWNWLMPDLFGLKTLDYWQALGLLVLTWIFFGRFRGGRGMHHWRHRLHERWEQMTPEEREKFREMRGRHWHHHHGEPPTSGNAT